jgi:hypothetical protein
MTLKTLLPALAATIFMSCSNPKTQTEATELKKEPIQKAITNQAKPPLSDSNAGNKSTAGTEERTNGDFNGDGRTEYAYLIAPETNDDMDCNGACDCVIRFSDTTIPAIKIRNCIGGLPDNLGDLNGDGADDIGLLPSWFTSCWAEYYTWTLKPGQWTHLVKPFSTHCNQWEEGIKPVEKDASDSGKVVIRYSVWENDDIMLKEKSVATE